MNTRWRGEGRVRTGSTGEPGRSALAMFPGQGSQRPGMATEVLGRFPEAAGEVFAMADGVLGLPLTELCVAGSREELRRTEITQPAIVATSLAVLAALRARGFE